MLYLPSSSDCCFSEMDKRGLSDIDLRFHASTPYLQHSIASASLFQDFLLSLFNQWFISLLSSLSESEPQSCLKVLMMPDGILRYSPSISASQSGKLPSWSRCFIFGSDRS